MLRALFNSIDVSALGDNLVIPGRANHRILIVSLTLVASGVVVVTLNDTVGYPVMGGMSFVANSGVAAGVEHGIAKASVGAGVNLNLSAAIQVGGSIGFVYEGV